MTVPSYALGHSKGHHHESSKDHHRECSHEPIVGAWLYSLDLQINPEDLVTSQGVMVIHADGTFVFQDSLGLTQNVPDTGGFYFTIATGEWQKLDKRHYEGVASYVILARGTQCVAPSDQPGCLALPAIPISRAKVIFQDLILDQTKQTAVSSYFVTYHPVDDLTLTLPTPGPGSVGIMRLQRLQ